MSKYDGLIIPRSYSEYINKTDAATLSQALALPGVMDAAPTPGSTKPAQSGGIYTAINDVTIVVPSDDRVITGAPLTEKHTVKVFFTAAQTANDTTTCMTLSYNGATYPVKACKDGELIDFVAHSNGSDLLFVQAYVTLEMMFDGTQFIIMGNPAVISNADYVLYADGSKTYTSAKIENKLEWVLLANLNLNEQVQIPSCKEFLLRHEDNSGNTYTEIIPYDTFSGFYAIGGDDGNGLVPYVQLYSDYKLEFKRGSNHVLSVFVRY